MIAFSLRLQPTLNHFKGLIMWHLSQVCSQWRGVLPMTSAMTAPFITVRSIEDSHVLNFLDFWENGCHFGWCGVLSSLVFGY